MREYVTGLSEEGLQCPVTCRSTRGQTWTFTLWRMMLHLLQHQSYHRGQVTALLRQLGPLRHGEVDKSGAEETGAGSGERAAAAASGTEPHAMRVQKVDLGRRHFELPKKRSHLTAMVALVLEQVQDHAPQRVGPGLPPGADAGNRTLERFLAQAAQVLSRLALHRLPALG